MLSNFLGISKMAKKMLTGTTTAFCNSSQSSTTQHKPKARLLWYEKDALVPPEVKIRHLLKATVRLRWLNKCRNSWQERAPKYFLQRGHTVCPKPVRGCFKAVVLKLWSSDQHYWHHVGTCSWQCWTSAEPCDPEKEQRLRPPPFCVLETAHCKEAPFPCDLDKTHRCPLVDLWQGQTDSHSFTWQMIRWTSD